MNTKQRITRTTIIFASLLAAGLAVAISSRLLQDAFGQSLLIAIGSALFGSGLTFFLVRMSMLLEK
jgi:hypothetical protein